MGVEIDMSIDLNKSRINVYETDDKDLVQLAGYHAYRYYGKDELMQVNGKKFLVKDTKYDAKSGLDALTVQNISSGELSVVYVGSDQLVGD